MEKYKKYDFIEVVHHYDTEKGLSVELNLITQKYYNNSTSNETINFFKKFGKSYKKIYSNYTKTFSSCDGCWEARYYFKDIDSLLSVMGWIKQSFNNHKDTWILRDENSIERGLIYHDTIVVVFDPCKGLYVPTWYSSTTTRRIQEYANIYKKVLRKDYPINKKSTENGLMCWFKEDYVI